MSGKPRQRNALARSLAVVSVTGAAFLLIFCSCPGTSLQDLADDFFDVPVVESIAPTSGPEAGGTKITIAGRNFSPNAGIMFGTVSAESVNRVNRGMIEAVTPAHAPGMADISVVNGVGQKTVVPDAFEFEAFDPPPPMPLNLIEVLPSQAPANAHTPITLFGSNFVEDCTVMFGAFLCSEVEMLDKSTLRVMAPPQAPGIVDIIVRRANGVVSILPDAFEYLPAAARDLPGSPRLVSAVSTGNTSVRVTFSEPVGEGAETASNYSIVQTNVNPEAGALRVLLAELQEDETVVRLTTMSQNEVVYTLTVTHIRDLAGNELAPPSIMVNPAQTEFAGTPPVTTEIADSDGDGLPDHAEQRGWTVRILLANGDVEERGVTSDPTSKDTDRDGIDDQEEHRRGMDPRLGDTDADELSDKDEVRTWFSDPTNQDTDQDGLSDTADVYFKTSPILADTDGDGFGDWDELFEMNRNPRLADLPQPQLTIGDMRLQIDERYAYVDHVGNTVTEASSSSSTLSQSESTKYSHSNTNANEYFAEWGAKGGYNKGLYGEVSGKGGYKFGSTSQYSNESAKSSQQAYQNSLAKGRTYTTTSTVSREVHGASLDVGLTLGNASDIAFTLSNVEVSAMQPGRTRNQFVPVATLLPSAELLTGEPSVFNLFPLEERGPILFSNREIFPNLVEDLMRAPRGMIFKVTYFDITDEFGRNLAFTTQDVLERTGTLIVDPGNGTFERFYVATSGGLDTKGYLGGGLVGGYDADGVAIGVPMDFVLQDILGLVKNPDLPNAIVAGHDGVAQTIAAEDDIQAVPLGTEGLPDRTIVVLAGENGVLDTVPGNARCEGGDHEGEPCHGDDDCPDGLCTGGGDDTEAFTTGYQTSDTCDENTPARIIEPDFGGDGIASTVAQGDDVQEVPVRYCIGGIKAGEFCTQDAQCPEAICAFNDVCVDGENAGEDCAEDRDCNPYCDLAADPAICAGGENDGTDCSEDRECQPYCDLDAELHSCVGGDHAGDECTTDADCIEASCERFGTCAGGFLAGNACDGDGECVTRCDGSDCVGGDDPAPTCTDDEECLPHCDLEVEPPVCVGGENHGNTCNEDRDCRPHCHAFLCEGGVDDGDVCETDADCEDGDCPSDPPLPGQPIVSAGDDGLLQTVANGDDEYRGPGTICDDDAVCKGQKCEPEDDSCPPGTCTGREVLVRYENSLTGDPNRFWVILSSDEIPIGTDFGDFLLKPDEEITLAFGQDIDRDGLFAREEYLYGSSDRLKDTDEEGLFDFAEIRVGWDVTVYRPKTAPEHAKVFPHPTLSDSDFDGLDDYTEMRCGTDPRKRDTDGDGLSDLAELNVCSSNPETPESLTESCCGDGDRCTVAEPCVGDAIAPGANGQFDTDLAGDDTWYPDPDDPTEIRTGDNGILDSEKAADDVFLSSDCPDERPVCVSIVDVVCTDEYDAEYPPEYLDPHNADTDGDSLEDGLEISLASQLVAEEDRPNPLNPCDADMFRDTDLDGLTDQEEREGWEVVVDLCDEPNCTSGVESEWCLQRGGEWHEAENLVQNGEFERDVAGWEMCTDCGPLPADCESMHPVPHAFFNRSHSYGWNGERGFFALNDWKECEGRRSWISQSIQGLVPGNVYLVSGYYRSGADWFSGPSFQVLIDNLVLFAGGNTWIRDWTPFTFQFVATQEAHTLEIRSEVGSQSYYHVDGIRVTRHDTCAYVAYPDPTEGDSDFDGLPDYLEAELGTDPQDDDTDCDGLLDYDEFDEFGAYMNLSEIYPGFYLSGADSLPLGTNPTSQDTDFDRLPDTFELYDGWRVLACGFDAPRNVDSDPVFYDSDLDGLSDLEEYLGANGIPPDHDGADYDATDPTDPDTDDDGYLDSDETFPLGCAKMVTVELHDWLLGKSVCEGGGSEFVAEFVVEYNLETLGRWRLSSSECASGGGTWCGASPTDMQSSWCQSFRPRATVPIDLRVGPFEMRPNDQVTVSGTVLQVGGSGCSNWVIQHAWYLTPRIRTFDTMINEFFFIEPTGDADACFGDAPPHRIKLQLTVRP